MDSTLGMMCWRRSKIPLIDNCSDASYGGFSQAGNVICGHDCEGKGNSIATAEADLSFVNTNTVLRSSINLLPKLSVSYDVVKTTSAKAIRSVPR